MPYIDQQSQQADIQTMKALADPRPAEPDQQWGMELEKRAKEASMQVETHRRELDRWQRMSRAVHAALAALHEAQEAPEEYDQAEGPGY